MSVSKWRRSFLARRLLIGIPTGILLSTLLQPALIQAQVTTGSIEVSVRDDKQEALPGALVSARNLDTGLERGVTTRKDGDGILLGLPPGRYLVRPTLTGYGVPPQETVVSLGQTSSLEFAMQPVSGVVEKVQVGAGSSMIDNEKPEISTVVTERQIGDYPLLNREFSDLATLAPGVRQAPTGQAESIKKKGVYTPFTTGGTDGRNLSISIDGANNADSFVGFYL